MDPMPLGPTPPLYCLLCTPGAASLQITCLTLPSWTASYSVLSFAAWSGDREQRGREVSASGSHSGGHCWQLPRVCGAAGMGHLQGQQLGQQQEPPRGPCAPEVSESRRKAAGAGPGGLVWEQEQVPDPYAQLLPFTAPPSLSRHFSSPHKSSAWRLLLSFWPDKN